MDQSPSNRFLPSVARFPGWWAASLLALAASALPSTAQEGTGFDPVELPRGQKGGGLPERLSEKIDTGLDDWDTEVLNDAAGRQLKLLRKLLERAQPLTADALAPLVHGEFRSPSLVPDDLESVFDDGSFRVRRWNTKDDTQVSGLQGAVDVFGAMRAALGAENGARVELKQVRIDTGADSFTIRLFVHAGGRVASGDVQHNAVWDSHWSFPTSAENGSGDPRLRAIDVKSFEDIHLNGVDRKLFVDCTRSAMAADASYEAQVLPGLPHWAERIPQQRGMTDFGHHGIAVGDVNGDDLDDLYVCDSGGLPNRLYVQQPDGTVRDIASEAGVDWLDYCSGALLLDLDNDGDQDLIVATRTGILFAENDGKARFQQRGTPYPVGDAVSLAAADFDEDRDLDLFICNYRGSDVLALPAPVPLYDAKNGGRNLLLRNDGDFSFSDIATTSGLSRATRFSFAAAWEDYDNDGDLDLYVANDFGPNNLYRNEDGRFTDVAASAAVEDRATGMSACWADYNHDGWMDIYVGNMFSSAGQRVAYQRRFAEASGDATAVLQRFARGNTLFANAGDGSFQDVSEDSQTVMGRWAWASKFADLNNDGWQDLVVANGYLTNEDSGDL